MSTILKTFFVVVMLAPNAFADVRCSVHIGSRELGISLRSSEGIFTSATLEDGGPLQKAACVKDDKVFFVPNVYTCDFSTFMESGLAIQFQVLNEKIVRPTLRVIEIRSQVLPLNCAEEN